VVGNQWDFIREEAAAVGCQSSDDRLAMVKPAAARAVYRAERMRLRRVSLHEPPHPHPSTLQKRSELQADTQQQTSHHHHPNPPSTDSLQPPLKPNSTQPVTHPRLQVCPSLVRLLACFEDDDEVQVVMEICNGGDVQQLSEVRGWGVWGWGLRG